MTPDLSTVPTGPLGTAARFDVARTAKKNPAGLAAWLITAPVFHPAWSQYYLGVITLADFPGLPPAVKNDASMTHELMVLAIDPMNGPHTVDSIISRGYFSHLTPGNIAQQFVCDSDDIAVKIGWLCVAAVLNGMLNPETADAPDAIRAHWKVVIANTLDHARGLHG